MVYNEWGYHFSASEHVVGIWFGETLYEKTFEFGTGPNATTKSVQHGIVNAKNIVDIKVIGISLTSVYDVLVAPAAHTVASGSLGLYGNLSTITMYSSTGNYSDHNFFVTLKYTKKS